MPSSIRIIVKRRRIKYVMIFSLFDERDEKARWGMMENKSQ